MSVNLHLEMLRARTRQQLQLAPRDIDAVCALGKELHAAGLEAERRKCYKAAVETLLGRVRAGDADHALQCELLIYEAFVRTIEDEQHYHRCFNDWKDALAGLARKSRVPESVHEIPGAGIAFVLQTGLVLGHTEVLFKLLALRPPDVRAAIYVVEVCDPRFLQRCSDLGVDVVQVEEILGNIPLPDRYLWLRQRLRDDGCGTCVWTSGPARAAYALALRLAPVQIYWSLRFHPVSGSYIDGYITYGAVHETTRPFGKQNWTVCPVPLALDDTPPDAAAVKTVRALYPEQVLLGSIAREDKINSKPFLEAVCTILRAHPQAGYVWTGKFEHAGVVAAFRAGGVADRCHFAGWVDSKVYGAAVDVFLETFPFGCGITGYQAMAAGTPLLSYFEDNTVFGMSYKPGMSAAPSSAELAQYPVACARNAEDYIALAGRLITDAAFREATAQSEQRFFAGELASGPERAARFFNTIKGIADRTAAAAGT